MSVFSSWADKVKGLEVLTLPALEDNYIYVLVAGSNAVAIDPADASPVLRLMKQRICKLTHVLLTHHHHDHVAGVSSLKKATGCHVVGPNDPRIQEVDEAVSDGSQVEAGPWNLRVIATPGHTHTHIAYHEPGRGLLWTGDSLFAAGCGRLFDCPPELLSSSLQKLSSLPDATQFFCGHEYTVDNLRFAAEMEPSNQAVKTRMVSAIAVRGAGQPTVPSTIGLEKQTNPFLRLRSPELRSKLGLADASDQDVFTALRRRKDSFQ